MKEDENPTVASKQREKANGKGPVESLETQSKVGIVSSTETVMLLENFRRIEMDVLMSREILI